MTADEVRTRLAVIYEVRADDERAHSYEDQLWRDVLETIADGKAEDPRELARLALSTTGFIFNRWCA